jgi:hypothetical protein
MPTGQTIITNSLVTLNVIDAGGGVSASENADLLQALNVFLDSMAADGTLIPSIATAQYLLTAATNPYSLGAIASGFKGAVLLGASFVISAITNANPAVMTVPAETLAAGALVMISGFTGAWAPANGCWPITVGSSITFSIPIDSTGFSMLAGSPVYQIANVTRPVRVDQAVLVSTVGSGTTRKPLHIVGSTQYFGHGDLAAAATTVDELYLDYGDVAGVMLAYLFPVPSCPTKTQLELETWNAIAAFALATNQNLPPGYEYYITNTVAFLALTRYGAVVNAETAQLVTGIAGQARDRIRELNQKNRLLDVASVPPTQEQLQAAQAQQPRPPQAGR